MTCSTIARLIKRTPRVGDLRTIFRRPTLLFAVLLFAAPVTAFANNYPGERPVKIVVPVTAGSGADVATRILAHELKSSTGGGFVIENQAGALGTIGAAAVANSAPDGHTILLSGVPTIAAAEFTMKNLAYNPLTSFDHIGRFGGFQWVLVANPNLPITDAKGFISLAIAQPAKFTYAFATSSSQVAGASFNRQFGIQASGVPYRGHPPALTDIMAGRIDYMIVDTTTAAPMIEAGQIRALAVAAKERSRLIPNVPTFEEAGLTSFVFDTWTGFSAPKGLPPNILSFLSTSIVEALKKNEIVNKLRGLGFEPKPLPSSEFAVYVKEQREFWRQLTAAAGIVPQ